MIAAAHSGKFSLRHMAGNALTPRAPLRMVRMIGCIVHLRGMTGHAGIVFLVVGESKPPA